MTRGQRYFCNLKKSPFPKKISHSRCVKLETLMTSHYNILEIRRVFLLSLFSLLSLPIFFLPRSLQNKSKPPKTLKMQGLSHFKYDTTLI